MVGLPERYGGSSRPPWFSRERGGNRQAHQALAVLPRMSWIPAVGKGAVARGWIGGAKRYTSAMPSEIDTLREAFRSLTRDYIRALEAQELGGLDGMVSPTGEAINAWVDKMNIADEINGRRLAAREDLLSAMRAAT